MHWAVGCGAWGVPTNESHLVSWILCTSRGVNAIESSHKLCVVVCDVCAHNNQTKLYLAVHFAYEVIEVCAVRPLWILWCRCKSIRGSVFAFQFSPFANVRRTRNHAVAFIWIIELLNRTVVVVENWCIYNQKKNHSRMFGISKEYPRYSCTESKLGTSLEAINWLFYFCGTGNSM